MFQSWDRGNKSLKRCEKFQKHLFGKGKKRETGSLVTGDSFISDNESLKGLVNHKQRWREVIHFVKHNCVEGNAARAQRRCKKTEKQ